ncbi:hypothetical protein RvY_04720 [Ramazzottius varieornatus]|uniref:Uncharacterized protein n=1 Tax=Ramazzottius varieornatus TaxID=947166 RepID=A0A1D1UT88_RAMVA|nr:hypothetical protein RvY_04720 [Ramazzottius varieornatus]
MNFLVHAWDGPKEEPSWIISHDMQTGFRGWASLRFAANEAPRNTVVLLNYSMAIGGLLVLELVFSGWIRFLVGRAPFERTESRNLDEAEKSWNRRSASLVLAAPW